MVLHELRFHENIFFLSFFLRSSIIKKPVPLYRSELSFCEVGGLATKADEPHLPEATGLEAPVTRL